METKLMSLIKCIAIVVITCMLLFCTFGCSINSVKNLSDGKNSKVFTSKYLHISLRYQKDWHLPILGSNESYGTLGRYEGKDGFFEVSCVTTEGKTINEFVKNSLKNFIDNNLLGMKPKLTTLKIDNQQARLIMPSNDEPSESNNESILFVEYPKNIKIRGVEHTEGSYSLFNIFMLTADKSHIIKIANTIKFI